MRAAVLQIAHQWSRPVSGDLEFVICLACGRRARSELETECTGQRPWVASAQANSNGHTIWAAGVVERPGDLVLLCSRCGRQEVGASGRPPFWNLECVASLEGRRWGKTRFFSGLHPDVRVRSALTPPFRLTDE